MKSIIRIKLQGIQIFMITTNELLAEEENTFQFLIGKKKDSLGNRIFWFL